MKDLSWLSRTEALIGRDAVEKLTTSHVMVLGLGGVGSYAAEFICRAGVGKMTIIDGDTVDPTNRNRQLPALSSNHGISKANIMKQRLLDINPELELNVIDEFIIPERLETLLETKPDYIVEAIDSITPKLFLIRRAYAAKIPFVSSMGAGGKVDPTKIQIADISKSYNCKLALHIRKKLRKHDIREGVKVAFSTELPDKASLIYTDGSNFKKSAYGTMSYLPAAFGGAIASVAIRELIGKEA
ncbi:tRNA A37 threonylcarbamoyladenosine dehydratase [Sphingobacterium nematocida]|uniref:tRNA A37 threonylcarbamoyladenosine dehydratase n=1 Tax=Sphingobacterium nematocida TaxID=1513896 RepID=A0A1T5CWV6_9SPHI|nr:tRNA threonylcarbamoyladenosine dehydratase [Sphingobacterium nematocida]SKB64008.1 tRNA A37 threonylcarbamoyladenosine dehydratase [Sphingobacterium nematocida]